MIRRKFLLVNPNLSIVFIEVPISNGNLLVELEEFLLLREDFGGWDSMSDLVGNSHEG